MKFSINGTTIVESMVVMMIVTVGVVGMYTLYNNSQTLSETSSFRLQAISMAKESIEAITNIRDTNWLLFPANTQNCWNTYNYDSNCIVSDVNISSGTSYVLYNDVNNRWFLSGAITGIFSEPDYRERFQVNMGSGFYTQSGGTKIIPTFTREIQITYPEDAGTPPEKMDIKSIVRWKDSSGTKPHEIIVESSLSNWK